MVHLAKHPPLCRQNSLPLVMWPRYARSDVFFSSTLDYILAANFYNRFIVGIVQKLIITSKRGTSFIQENSEINLMGIPVEFNGKYSFGEIFAYLVSLPEPIVAIAVYRGKGVVQLL